MAALALTVRQIEVFSKLASAKGNAGLMLDRGDAVVAGKCVGRGLTDRLDSGAYVITPQGKKVLDEVKAAQAAAKKKG